MVADFGLRPRRATARPGVRPAQVSQRSACFAPRRASVYVTRITAPLASSTSLPQLSQTSTVFRATVVLLLSVLYGANFGEIYRKSKRAKQPRVHVEFATNVTD